MGWILTIAFLIIAVLKGTADITANASLIAAALFAIAGSISSVAVVLKPKQDQENKE